MLKVQEIREIIKLIDESSIDEFTYETNGSTIMMKKSSNRSGDHVQNHDPVTKEQVVTVTQPVTEKTTEEIKTTSTIEADKSDEESTVDADDVHLITSPMVGTFYRASSPEKDPYVKTGSKIEDSTVVCIVEAMKLFNEIEAEVTGEITEILVEDGELVEYGQPLFNVKTK